MRLFILERKDNEWVLNGNGQSLPMTGLTRKGAIHESIQTCHRMASEEDPIELKVRKLDGEFSKFSNTYPRSADPKSSKG